MALSALRQRVSRIQTGSADYNLQSAPPAASLEEDSHETGQTVVDPDAVSPSTSPITPRTSPPMSHQYRLPLLPPSQGLPNPTSVELRNVRGRQKAMDWLMLNALCSSKARRDRPKPAFIGDRNAVFAHNTGASTNASEKGASAAAPGYGMVAKTLSSEQLAEIGCSGFSEVPWDGEKTIPLLDSEGRVYGLLGGKPRDRGWDDLCKRANAEVERQHKELNVSDEKREHRRAARPFAAVARRVSHGGGQTVRSSFSPAALMALWAPKLYEYYLAMQTALLLWKPSLRQGWPFKRSIFAACTINFKTAVSCRHLDFGNLA
ncbi:hypothetical protein MIND_00489200 [Mycena indigotica]|uniref:Uncharacterized protein n=1 Tax=Mycena indigotica TaxID=2126181 RepID=A0A8H6SX43_9AGAR|nr:uncharacterized protein MIND_00489200 [Mycena indigotica]KAF7306964.1 hypothetical protein MIND_00489200 [Mycena indigotica]